MRKAMPKLGFKLVDGDWVNKETGEVVNDEAIEDHHTRLAARIATNRAVRLAAKLGIVEIES
jgi:hypothetical protein